ncbi:MULTISPECIES: M48 family metalloprotease [unclassified Streptomyces]|uniref:M48 family metalloprotease n=1 Tax=unclassified Streptomyces TaxID=2593676 RepID=UPI0022518AA9|nr:MULTISPECIES: M48 family metalloprotease [unclassified Streptomyces]MCX4987568.1 M48 family metalloprotease [Streptomyces sp. NBC_00568]MCX5007299.1 M48 family metalloprotease [Streptomyces sp. NBC_00638]
MTFLLLIPLLVPFVVGPPARRCLERLAPATALWAVTLAMVVLAGASVASLGALLLTGLLKLPFLAGLGDLVHPLRTAPDLVVLPAAAAATGALTVGAWTVVRSGLRQLRAFRSARSQADRRPAAGDLCVIESPHPDAYALPGRPHRIVVTTAMLRSLGADEREALFAHERAHNAGGHHRFLVAAELAAHCHPGLRAVRATVALAAERAADEAAAVAVGDRRLTARAIARAALAVGDARSDRPGFAPAATTGPVPQRVAALLSTPRHRPRAAVRIALVLAACAAVSAGASGAGVLAFHHEVEVAQGEEPR